MKLAWLSLALALAAGAPETRAHQAMSGWAYEYACCGMNDCAPLKPAQVKETRGGYVITIPPGSHPQVPAGGETITVTVPYNGTRPSPDGLFHICLAASDKRVLCLYAPPSGS